MSWADNYIKKLQAGKTVQFRPRGNSMTPRIKSGQLVTVKPLEAAAKFGDVVLCKVKGCQYLHIVKGLEVKVVTQYGSDYVAHHSAQGIARYQIGNNHGKINGWTAASNVYGIVTKVEP